MGKPFSPKIVSANDLFDGDVVYLDRTGGWTRNIGDARIAATPEEASTLDAAAHQPARVIGPYLVDVALDPAGRPRPVHYREVLRDAGPTTRPDLDRKAQPVAA